MCILSLLCSIYNTLVWQYREHVIIIIEQTGLEEAGPFDPHHHWGREEAGPVDPHHYWGREEVGPVDPHHHWVLEMVHTLHISGDK